MAEFKMPKFVYKDKPISVDACYQGLADMNYQSPINIMYQGLQTKFEGDVMTAIQSYGVDVDKDELVKALKYDRDQYRKGYIDGCKVNRVDKIKAEVAREIFEEIESICWSHSDNHIIINRTRLAELKKKYTLGDKKPEAEKTLYDRIKAMTLDEMVSFLAYLYKKDIIAEADRYICRKCKEEHGGHCPIGDDDTCLYDMSDKDTIKLWLEGDGYGFI